jgi:hypothetical protein
MKGIGEKCALEAISEIGKLFCFEWVIVEHTRHYK